jgi:hypothetical protein
LEAVAAITLFYFALPTVDKLAPAAAQAASASRAYQIDYSPWLTCWKITPIIKADSLTITTIWKATKAQSINYFVTAKALDSAGQILASARYAMDGRQQSIKAGDCWVSRISLPVASKQHPSTIELSITRGQRKDIQPILSQSQPESGRQPVIINLKSVQIPIMDSNQPDENSKAAGSS